MYQLLQPQLDIVLFEIIFPLMCFSDNDQRLWNEDPHEYVRKGYGELPQMIFLNGVILNFHSSSCYLNRAFVYIFPCRYY